MIQQPEVHIESDGKDIFVRFGGLIIAKRGRPGTPQARTWISLEPGYTVISDTNHETITVEYKGEKFAAH